VRELRCAPARTSALLANGGGCQLDLRGWLVLLRVRRTPLTCVPGWRLHALAQVLFQPPSLFPVPSPIAHPRRCGWCLHALAHDRQAVDVLGRRRLCAPRCSRGRQTGRVNRRIHLALGAALRRADLEHTSGSRCRTLFRLFRLFPPPYLFPAPSPIAPSRRCVAPRFITPIPRQVFGVRTSSEREAADPVSLQSDKRKPDAEKGRQREEQDEEGPLSTQTQEGPVGALQLCEHTGPVSLFAL